MTIGSSIFLIAVGAILRYAISASTSGVSLPTIGLILMIAGAVGLVVSLFYVFAWRPRRPYGGFAGRGPPEEPPDVY